MVNIESMVWCCKKKYSFHYVNSNAVLLLMIWLFILGLCNGSLLVTQLPSLTSHVIFVNFNNFQFLLYPVLGLMIDVWSTRLKLVKLCVVSIFPALLLGLCSNILTFLDSQSIVISWILVVTFTVPFAIYRTNVVPLYMDQMVGSSGDELSAVIYWHTLILVLPVMITQLFHFFVAEESSVFILQLATLLATLYILPYSYSKLGDAFDNSPQIVNPVKLVFKVLKYVSGSNHMRYRSALTYWEEDYPSRLDLGKRKYGGPFTEGEVEDVKTTVRIIPLLMCTLAHLSITTSCKTTSSFFNQFFSERFHSHLGAWPANLIHYSTIVFLILVNQFIINPFFREYIPTMLKRIGIGMFCALFSTATMIVLPLFDGSRDECITMNNFSDIVMHDIQKHAVAPYWFTIPLISGGISYYFIVVASLEFTVAQSPYHMRGLLIGLWYTFWGVGTIVNVDLHYLFRFCEIHYFIAKGILGLILLMLFLVLAKYYKLRARNLVYNAFQVTEDKIMKNIENSRSLDKKLYGVMQAK